MVRAYGKLADPYPLDSLCDHIIPFAWLYFTASRRPIPKKCQGFAMRAQTLAVIEVANPIVIAAISILQVIPQ